MFKAQINRAEQAFRNIARNRIDRVGLWLQAERLDVSMRHTAQRVGHIIGCSKASQTVLWGNDHIGSTGVLIGMEVVPDEKILRLSAI